MEAADSGAYGENLATPAPSVGKAWNYYSGRLRNSPQYVVRAEYTVWNKPLGDAYVFGGL